jgi:hypothetical protein
MRATSAETGADPTLEPPAVTRWRYPVYAMPEVRTRSCAVVVE